MKHILVMVFVGSIFSCPSARGATTREVQADLIKPSPNQTNGNITLTPNGTGKVIVSSGNMSVLGTLNNQTLNFDMSLGNTLLGRGVGESITTGYQNTLVGYRAGQAATTGYNNVLIGYQAGESLTTAEANIAIGYQAVQHNTTGVFNEGIGVHALHNVTTGDQNVAMGGGALETLTTGSNNIAIGKYAGESVSTGSGNVFLGFDAGYNETGSNKLYIANNDTTTLIYGKFDTGLVGINNTSPTYTLDVKNGQAIASLASTTAASAAYMRFANNGGTAFAGLEGSPVSIVTGAGAYDFSIAPPSGKKLVLGYNGGTGVGLYIDSSGNTVLGGTANNVGTITGGHWAGSTIESAYGGTGMDTSASTGYPSISSGTWSVASAASTFSTLYKTVATTLGDIVYGGASGTPTRLAGDTSNTRKFLREQSSGGTAAAPAWDTITSGDLPTIALTGDVTGSASGGSIAATLAATSNGTLATLSKSTGVAVHGTNTNDSAAAGYFGEFASAGTSGGSDVTPAASGSGVDIATVSLTAGDWDVEGTAVLVTSGTTMTGFKAAISTGSTGTFDSSTSGGVTQQAISSSTFVDNNGAYFPTGTRRITLGSTTTVRLVGALTYTTLGSAVWYHNSFIRARRAR